MENCIFCKIVKGELPSYKVYEDEKVMAFLDINPYVTGHTLIIPKEHSRWLWDTDESDYMYLMGKTRLLANKLRQVFATDWIEEIVAGMGVAHTHIHLLPRTQKDGLDEVPNKPLIKKPSAEEMKRLAERIIRY